MLQTRNCCFTKTVLAPGTGFTCPVLESKCFITVREVSAHCGYALPDSFKDAVQEISDVTVGWPTNGTTKLLEELIMTMKMGEISQFDVSANLQLSLQQQFSNDPVEVKSDAFTIVLELLDFNDARPLWKLDNSEKYNLALCHKNEGSKLFQEGNVQAAFFHYTLSIKYLISRSILEEESDCVSDKCRKLKCVCYLNLAACQLKYKSYHNVIMNCSKALNIDGRNVKALYRRASAYKELGRNNDARSDLLAAKRHEPKNRVIQELLQSLTEFNS